MSTPLIFRIFFEGYEKKLIFLQGGEWAISDVGTVLLFLIFFFLKGKSQLTLYIGG